MGKKQLADQGWGGVAGGDVLDHLLVCLTDVDPRGASSAGWRDDLLVDLARLRDLLIAERPAAPRGAPVIRERSHLLSEVGHQRLQVLTSSDVDRLTFDLRRLAGEVGAHLGRAQTSGTPRT